MTAGPPVAVTFDFWDTLLHAPRAGAAREVRREALTKVFADAGIDVDRDHLDAALAEVRRAFDRSWAENRQFRAEHATELFVELIAAAEPDNPMVAGGFPAEVRPSVVEVFSMSGAEGVPELTPNVVPVLRGLKDRGVRLGIICDVGLAPSTTLRSFLEHHGVLDLFDHWSFSDEVGVYKPDPAIFRHALEGLAVADPGRAAHVGDLRRTDVVGAKRFGMVSVRYTGSNDDVAVPAEGDRAMLGGSGVSDADRVEADHVIADHAQLPEVLGLR